MPKSKVQLTNTFVNNIEKYLTRHGRSLDGPREVFDAEINGLCLRRQPSGSLLWYFAYRTGGKHSRVALGKYPALTVAAARLAAKAKAGEIALDKDPVAAKRAVAEKARVERAARARDKALLLRAFIKDRYAPWAEVHHKAHAHTLACLSFDFGPEGADWLDKPMTSITTFGVERWRRGRLKDGIKPATVERSWQRLRSVLSRAVEWGVLPADALPKVKPLRFNNARVRYLSPDELVRLRAAMQKREAERRAARERMRKWQAERGKRQLPLHPATGFVDHLQPLVRLLLGSGLRRNEALSLSWGDVDLQRKTVGVRGDVAKDREFRSVPITDDAWDALKRWNAQARSTKPEAFVFPGPKGQHLLRVDAAWGELMEAAKIEDFKVHDCRHHFASMLVQNACGLYEVSKLLGHSDTSMSERYAHLSKDYLRAAVDRLNKAETTASAAPVKGVA